MSGITPDEVSQGIEDAKDLYHRLVLVVAPSGANKTGVLKQVASQHSYPYLNINLELSRRMLDFAPRQRALRVGNVLGEIVDSAGTDTPVLLDNIEILFDRSLEQDPLRLLKEVSRRRPVVAAWNGVVAGDNLIYAEAGHPEYRQYPRQELDFLVLSNPEVHQ